MLDELPSMKELSVGQRRYKAVMAVLSVGRTVTSGVEPMCRFG